MKSEPPVPGPTVVSEKPYRFVPPRDSRFWPWFFCGWLPRYLRKSHGIHSSEVAGSERLAASLRAGHGILLVPNHPRPSDPMALGLITRAVRHRFYVMASAHLFLQSRFQTWLLPRIGAFSVYREGMDRESLKTGIDILANARRPLAVFAEGVVTRTNDRLIELQDGVAFMARTAAKQRAEKVPGGRVVVHPLAVRYTFKGDIEQALSPVLDKIETRLSWKPQRRLGLIERMGKLGEAILALKEIEHFGASRSGSVRGRLAHLLDGVLVPLEREWIKGSTDGSPVNRVKNLRKAILPGLVSGDIPEAERNRRWQQLYDLEVAGQIFHFPAGYLDGTPTPERLMETVERMEEAVDPANVTVQGPLHLRFEIGDAIPVEVGGDKRAVSNDLMARVRESLLAMLGIAGT
jgi:1-acyl-sn-glycerol-3-phosphate acyltransferase